MLDLQPLIARLVDDILRLIRGASIATLRDFSESTEADPSALRQHAQRPKPRAAPKPAARPKRRRTVRQRPTRTARAPEPALHAEITDPERLLAAAARSAPTMDSAREPAAPMAGEEVFPPSRERLAAVASVALRSGESVAHASERGGVVIRRRKRA
jgi:hypothetical protein